MGGPAVSPCTALILWLASYAAEGLGWLLGIKGWS